ncbi:MAG: hypothetical protein PVG07_01470, partial [Acidobacteriota bacterium]
PVPARASVRLLTVILSLALALAASPVARARDGEGAGAPLDWGGHLRLRYSAGRAAEESLFAFLGGERLVDLAPEARLKLRVGPFGPDDRLSLEVHAESVLRAGDTVGAERRLAELTESIGSGAFAELLGGVVDDERRLFDLTTTGEGAQYRATERVDRLVLGVRPDWGSVRIGRQALTWGNGMLFNPMDLFNPFSPTDVERDYKVGDDMVVVHRPGTAGGDLQLLGVPRRDPATGDVEWDASSVAAKLHRFLDFAGSLEVDLLAARHYGEPVLGGGVSGFLAGAVWRVDAVWSRRGAGPSVRAGEAAGDDFVAAVANLDRSWTWRGRNAYGFVEVYFNGLGHADAARALEDPAVLERLARGELFTLGRRYLDASVNLEAHPLVNLWLTTIRNLDDGSGLVQPRLVWNAQQDLEVVLGADLHYGDRGSELGGLVLPGLGSVVPGDVPPVLASPDRLYLWVSRYF